MKSLYHLITLFLLSSLSAQNPVVPGYFADPSIRYIDGKYYMSITSDGYEGHNGEPFIWVSDDLVNWDIEYLNINDRFFWAPSLLKGDNGKYYMVHQNGIDYMAYLMEADNILGPWKEILQIKDFDVELFRDPSDQNKIKAVGSWKKIMEFDNNISSSDYMKKIVKETPIEGEFTDFTEGPYAFYKDQNYYLMWAGGHCWLNSYSVRYSVSKSGFSTGYQEFSHDPILKTDPEKGIYGPGHTSVIEVNGRWLMFYHRQDAERQPTCNYRFSCVAELIFSPKGEIAQVIPLDDLSGIVPNAVRPVNLALNKPVVSNSELKNHPASAITDGKYDTRWQAEGGEDKWFIIDLQKKEKFSKIQVDFEYFDKYYLYKIEYSDDPQNWKTYADYTGKAQKAYETRNSLGNATARYVRISIKRAEGNEASLWEVKILK